MDKTFERIYDLTYNPLVTPFNLLSNINLENYHEINFKKVECEIVAEVKCTIDSKLHIFKYFFDNRNYLCKIISSTDNKEDVLFDRNVSLSNERETYFIEKSSKKNIV